MSRGYHNSHYNESVYLGALDYVLANGVIKDDRTGTGTISKFDINLKFDLRRDFPAVTTKKLFFDTMLTELIWFLGNHLQIGYYRQFGRTNIKYLVDNGCNIWNDWPHKAYCAKHGNIELAEFKSLIKNSDEFAKAHGNLGPVYGKQWRNWGGIDQIAGMIRLLKTDPDSRRNIVSAWNVGELEEMSKSGLPPCHSFFQVYTREDNGNRLLSLKWYQRSWDMLQGGPFNIASYAVLTHMFAQVTGYKVDTLSVSVGDAHVYSNHVDQVNEQCVRIPYTPPTLWVNPDITNINDFQREDVKLVDYQHHPSIKAPIAV